MASGSSLGSVALIGGGNSCKQQQQQQQQQQAHRNIGPSRFMKRSLSMNDSTINGGRGGEGHSKTCVCSPTTHAGSFKCRFHRVNSISNHQYYHGDDTTATATATATPSTPTTAMSGTILMR